MVAFKSYKTFPCYLVSMFIYTGKEYDCHSAILEVHRSRLWLEQRNRNYVKQNELWRRHAESNVKMIRYT